MSKLGVIDRAMDFQTALELNDAEEILPRLVLRDRSMDESSDDRASLRYLGPEAVLLEGTRVKELPAFVRALARYPKRNRQMMQIAGDNTNRHLQIIDHGGYFQVVAPPWLSGTEIFFGAGFTEALAPPTFEVFLLRCAPNIVLGAGRDGIESLLLLAVRNRLHGKLHRRWEHYWPGPVSVDEWRRVCGNDHDLFALGTEFV